MKISGKLYAALGSALLLGFAGTFAQAQSMMTRHTRPEVARGETQYMGRMPAAQVLRLNLALPLRNEAELDDLLQKLYDPQSPYFHQFLSVQEFTDRFGPTEEDYAAVVHFAQEHGLTVTSTSSNRLVVNVAGPVSKIETAFHVNMLNFRHPTEARTFYAPDREPSADLRAPMWHISGLDNYSIPHPASLGRNPEARGSATGSGPSGYFLGSDLRAAY